MTTNIYHHDPSPQMPFLKYKLSTGIMHHIILNNFCSPLQTLSWEFHDILTDSPDFMIRESLVISVLYSSNSFTHSPLNAETPQRV